MPTSYSENLVATAPLMLLVERLRRLQGFRIHNEIPDGTGGVTFGITHDVSALSWGESIHVHLAIFDNTRTLVQISSESSMPTQLFDLGQNKNNVFAIKRCLFANDVPVQPL